MTRDELTIVLQAILLSTYSKKSEAAWIVNRELKLKDMDPRKSDEEEKSYLSTEKLPS
jgi:hypothetical protein